MAMGGSVEAAPGRIRGKLTAVPASLAALVTVVVMIGLAWALLVAPWQSPDEPAHFAYVQSLAERLALPGARNRPQMSTDQVIADEAVGASLGAFYPQSSPPNWSRQAFDSYVAASSHNSRSNGGGPNPAGPNPPLYYLYADVAYLIDGGGNAFGQLYAIRIWGVLLLALTVLGAWLLAGETIGRRRIAQVACGAAVGLLPMETFISTSVNPDGMMVTLWTWAMWLGARVINRAAPRRDAVALCAVTAAAVLTKATSYALIPPALLALLIGWRRRPADQRGGARRELGVASLALVVPVLAWIALAAALHRSAVNTIKSSTGGRPFNVLQFISYVWQFYLPKLPFMTRLRETSGLPAYYVWLRQGWGSFGWLDVTFPPWTYRVLAVLSALVVIPAAALLFRVVNRRRLAVPALLLLTLLALLGGLHVTDYRSLIAGQGPILQGRYLLPVVALFGLSIAFLVSQISARRQAAACGVILALLLVLQVLSLSTVLHAYYT
jgi:4-amino-4-deoxy-L-arabinose transferase-like glycosyltransferase